MNNKHRPLSANLDGLQPVFISHLKTLFDILDEDNSGFVPLSVIESYWGGDLGGNIRLHSLPQGVIDALRKVSFPNGRLSFERFIAGIKIALSKENVVNDGNKMRSGQFGLNNRTLSMPQLFRDDLNILQQNNFQNGCLADNQENKISAFVTKRNTRSHPQDQHSMYGRSSNVPQQKNNPRELFTSENNFASSPMSEMELIIQERDLLAWGLQSIKAASVWFHQRLEHLNNRLQKRLIAGDTAVLGGPVQKRLKFESEKIAEITQEVENLMAGPDKMAPTSENSSEPKQHTMSEMALSSIGKLASQNSELISEMRQKSELIARLEREKASLVRQLFEANAKDSSFNDSITTLI